MVVVAVTLADRGDGARCTPRRCRRTPAEPTGDGTAAEGGSRCSRRRVAAPSPVWACGQRIEPVLNWTSAGFTKPVRLVLEGLLRPEREVTVSTVGGIVQSVRYRGRVPLLIEERVYAPLTAGALRGAAIARQLQSGRLGIYAVYLTGLLVGMLACVRLGLFG